MFLNSVQAYIILPIIAVVVLQYAFALFCLMKLAYLDISRKNYILWNVFILLVFFIGGAVFLVYYYKHPEKLIPKTPENASERQTENTDNAENSVEADTADGDENAVADNDESAVENDKTENSDD